jgi:hypothetical protein
MSILKGLLQDEQFLVAAGLLSAGSQGQGIGQAAFPALLQAAQIQKAFAPEDKERKIIKGADGFQYYVDTGERVFPDVVKEKKQPSKSVRPLTDKQKLGLDLNVNDNVTGTFDGAGNLIDYKVSSKSDDRMAKIGKAVKDSNLQEADEALRAVENYIVELKGLGYENLPGIGLIEGRTPGVAISAEGKKLRSLISGFENITLKKRSGAAVTPSELARVQQELAGAIKTGDENVLLDVIRRNRKVLEKQKKTVFAAYRPDDVNIYQDKGGLNYFNSPLNFELGGQITSTGLENLSDEKLQELLNRY